MKKDKKLGLSSENEKASAGFSITIRVKLKNEPGRLARMIDTFADSQASLAELTLVSNTFSHTIRDITVNCRTEDHARDILELIRAVPDAELMDYQDDTLALHLGGKLEVHSKFSLRSLDQLARAYTPGVARVCNRIAADPSEAYTYTIKKNCVAVVSDGSAVLGLGNIGPSAAMPVMEGKAILFKKFAGVDAFPICLATQDTEEIIKTVKALSVGFGGINLEDISAPRCFEIERRLQDELDIPVFHDDQHGTAVVVLAALINGMKLLNRKLEDLRIVINGFGAAGVAITRILVEAGVSQIIPVDSVGVIYRGREQQMNDEKLSLLDVTNPDNIKGSLEDAVKGADVFIGVSKPGVLTRAMVQTMNKEPIIFALSNPVPEILPSEIADIAGIIATGRSDYANQVNNVLCFPGIFRGALDSGAKKITMGMKIAAAQGIADCVAESELSRAHIIPTVFHEDVAEVVARAVAEEAIREGITAPERQGPRLLVGAHERA